MFAALDLSILWNKTGRQATVYATISDATLTALADLLNPRLARIPRHRAPTPASNNAVWALPQPLSADRCHNHRPGGVSGPRRSAPGQSRS